MTLSYAGTIDGSGPRGRSPEGSVSHAEIVNDPLLCRHCPWVKAKRRQPAPCSWMVFRRGSGSCFRTAISQVFNSTIQLLIALHILIYFTAETATEYIVLVGQKSYH
jgi:hypothetical protein